MTPIEVLKKAREFLSKPGAWCQWAFYRDANGRALLGPRPEQEPASACLEGACFLASRDESGSYSSLLPALAAIHKLEMQAKCPAWNYNDVICKSADDAIALIDRAIAANDVP